jgi:hypothetical protein
MSHAPTRVAYTLNPTIYRKIRILKKILMSPFQEYNFHFKILHFQSTIAKSLRSIQKSKLLYLTNGALSLDYYCIFRIATFANGGVGAIKTIP